jgi:hypothetical protein
LYNQYHFSEQLADRITVYNTSINGERVIAGYKFIFRQVRASFFRGIETVNAQGYGKYNRMKPERALIQLLDDSDGKLEYAEDIYQLFLDNKISKTKLLSLATQYASKRVISLVQQFLIA